MNNVKLCFSDSHDPYYNLALEAALLESVQKNECILYIWQNQRTVVIGRNQNAWQELKVEQLNEEQGHVARRYSGGGAVFQDLGNLNFTFLVHESVYDVDKQLSVILKALAKLGIHGEKNGRNDLTVENRKFSGNAYYKKHQQCYHHGTLLVNANMDDLSRYLNVSEEKLQSKGVASVRSRVVNLCELQPSLTVEQLKEKLVEAYADVYGEYSLIEPKQLDQQRLDELKLQFASWEWLYGRSIQFDHQLKRRFSWGSVDLQLHVDKGLIQSLNCYSDAMDQDFILALKKQLLGCRYTEADMCSAVPIHAVADEVKELIHDSFWRD